MKKIECYFDGSCEPKNPSGNMGIGALVKVDGVKVMEFSDFVPAKPQNTNNVAEYMGFEKIIDYLLENNLANENVSIFGDSQLVIKQMNGEWRIKDGSYTTFAQRCSEKLSKFEKVPVIQWIGRDLNTEADALSKGQLNKNGVQVATHSDDKTVFLFGKYKGKSVNDVDDLGYLQWVVANVKLKMAFRTLVEQQISKLEFLYK